MLNINTYSPANREFLHAILKPVRWHDDSTSGRRDATTLHHAKFVLCKVIKLPNYAGARRSASDEELFIISRRLNYRRNFARSDNARYKRVIGNQTTGVTDEIIVIYRGDDPYARTEPNAPGRIYRSDFSREKILPGFRRSERRSSLSSYSRGITAPGWRRNGERFNIHGRKYRARILPHGVTFPLKYREYFRRACSRATKYRHCHRV